MRRPSAPARLLPSVLVIGGQRCGTSSLYKYLSAHPDVAGPVRKEIAFFDRYFGRGEGWYRAHFPLRSRRLLQPRLTTFEATPDYLLDPRAPARAAALLPHARLVVLLRDPIARAWSHHQHMTRLGFEDLSFPDAVAAEERRLDGELERMAADPFYDCRPFRRYSYVTRGRYASQLDRWREHFPEERFLVVRSEDMFDDTPSVFERLLDFAGLARWQPAEFRNFSYRSARDSRGTRPPEEARSLLEGTFTSDNQRLVTLLGWDRSWEG